MLITVAICTFNRAESLRRTLDSLFAMRLPEDLDWEVVVVNNNSNDHTEAIIASYRNRLPIRGEFEAQPGQCNARNRAIDTAIGDYLVWTDDDVLVSPYWLSAYFEAFSSWPTAGVFGGPIIPRFDPPAPNWLNSSRHLVSGAFAERDLGASFQGLSVAGHRIPYGANFAIRAAEQRRFRYNPELGHMPGRKRIGDDVDVISRILDSGAIGYWIPEAKVEHCIGQDRQTIEYLLRYFATIGETEAFLHELHRTPIMAKPHLVFGIPRWWLLSLIRHWLGFRLCRLIAPATVWVSHLRDYAHARGVVSYWRRKPIKSM